jgi:hypothetical protein
MHLKQVLVLRLTNLPVLVLLDVKHMPLKNWNFTLSKDYGHLQHDAV